MAKVDVVVKTARASEFSSDEETRHRNETVCSSDDEEANADLSLEVIKKAMLRKCENNARDESFSEIVTVLKSEKKKKVKKKSRKSNGIEVAEAAVSIEVGNAEDEMKPEASKAIEISDKVIETNVVEASDNIVLRKLLRGPRYFDPPNNSWGACYNCGEDGHTAVNCTSAKRKKPCFVCGSFEHNAKQCTKGRDCYICKQQGHRAKDCPDKSQSSKICLRCGDEGHELFFCRNNYSPDDLKNIQCYVCQKFGHLCCVKCSDPGPTEVSCYRCGLAGHTGMACTGSRTDINVSVLAHSCYKCGIEGHFARECTSTKLTKRNRELSTPKVMSSKKKKDHMEIKSAPHDLGNKYKKKRIHDEFTTPAITKRRGGWITEDPGEFTTPAKTKRRGGWITEDPGDFHSAKSKSKPNSWSSPLTPKNRGSKFSSSNSSFSSSSRPPQRYSNFSHGSSHYYSHRFSASQYGNSSNDWYCRSYNRW